MKWRFGCRGNLGGINGCHGYLGGTNKQLFQDIAHVHIIFVVHFLLVTQIQVFDIDNDGYISKDELRQV